MSASFAVEPIGHRQPSPDVVRPVAADVFQPETRMAPPVRLGLCTRALFLIAAAVVAASTAGRAQSSGPAAGVYEIVLRSNAKCLGVAGQSPGDQQPVVQTTCTGSDSQHWAVKPLAGGAYRLVAQDSGKALDVWDSSIEEGAAISERSPNGSASQDWAIQSSGDGYYYLFAGHSGKALSNYAWSDSDGVQTIQWTPLGQLNQQWQLRPVASSGGDPSTANIVRFLEQATWGPTPELIEHVRNVGFEGYLNEQFSAPMSSYPTLPPVLTTRDTTACPNGSTCQRDNYSMYLLQNKFFTNALYGPDQLRQRVAFALHQIIVVSGVDINLPFWMAPYLQLLDRHAFGSYRDLLYDITLNPAMGNYLDVTGNAALRLDANGNRLAGPPNENYAREVLQLFSIGTFKLNLDGTQQLDASGQPIPTYGQDEVNNFARVFTGWVRATAPGTGMLNYIDPMVPNNAAQTNHDKDAKTLLNGVVLQAGQGQTLVKDTNDAIDNIVTDPSFAPYISKLLIQDLVTSNPTPAYVERVARAFRGDVTGIRGDLKAAVRAILLDAEARGDVKTDAGYGRLRHPLQLITNVLRAFGARSKDLSTESDGVLAGQSVNMGMDLFRPPSVFSYFSPFNGVPGGGGLRGPEFQLLSTSTSLIRANFVNTMLSPNSNTATAGGIAVSNPNTPNGTALNMAPYQALAGNPAALVDTLNVLLLHGTMSTDMRTSVIGAVNAVAAGSPLKRARTAAYLVLTSSQYQVER